MRTPDLHPLLARRWSPLGFDESHSSRPTRSWLLLRRPAGRRRPATASPGPSSSAAAATDVHERLVAAPGAERPTLGAASAALLVANLSHRLVESTDWEFSEFARCGPRPGGRPPHPAGPGAGAGGPPVPRVRPRTGIATDFEVPTHWEVTSMAAIGHPIVVSEPLTGRRGLAVTSDGSVSTRSLGASRRTPAPARSAGASREPTTQIGHGARGPQVNRPSGTTSAGRSARRRTSPARRSSRPGGTSLASSAPRGTELRGSHASTSSSGASISTSTACFQPMRQMLLQHASSGSRSAGGSNGSASCATRAHPVDAEHPSASRRATSEQVPPAMTDRDRPGSRSTSHCGPR